MEFLLFLSLSIIAHATKYVGPILPCWYTSIPSQSPQLDEWLRSMTPDVTFTTLYCFILSYTFFVRNVPPDDFALRKGTYVDGCRVGTKTKTAPWLVLPQVMKCEIISSIEYEEVMEALRKQRYTPIPPCSSLTQINWIMQRACKSTKVTFGY